ncbi:MAG: choice-of-anchor Q domain-containing protein, partial [Verrucomicrobiota bacterium]|nr:choice-of-anchor Q domain-containing protein [Verrucomicrobiota bacterium]
TGNINADLRFTLGYRLKAGSPCIDAGQAAGAPVSDFRGEAREGNPAIPTFRRRNETSPRQY